MLFYLSQERKPPAEFSKKTKDSSEDPKVSQKPGVSIRFTFEKCKVYITISVSLLFPCRKPPSIRQNLLGDYARGLQCITKDTEANKGR